MPALYSCMSLVLNHARAALDVVVLSLGEESAMRHCQRLSPVQALGCAGTCSVFKKPVMVLRSSSSGPFAGLGKSDFDFIAQFVI